MARGSGGGGSSAGAVLALLVLLAGAGGFNYYRNVQAEKTEAHQRPLAGYDDAGLEALANAYRSELKTLEARRATLRRTADPAAARGAFIGDNARAFERVQKSSQRVRDLLGEIAERQGRLAEIEKEQQFRSNHAASGIALHLGRLFRI